MINRKTTFHVNSITPIELCGNTVMWNMDLNGAFELPFDIEPTQGNHDFNTCEDCQKTLIDLTQILTKKINGSDSKKAFPNCCKLHSNLPSIVKEFNKNDYLGVPAMVARKIVYTNQHIINSLDTDNWKKQISDYIGWAVESFGQMPSKCGEPLFLGNYFNFVIDLLERKTQIHADKKNTILEIIDSYRNPKGNANTDLVELVRVYEKWINIFPFEVNSYFGNLKAHYKKQLPILTKTPENNTYSGLAKATIHTKESLGESLLQLTDDLLTKINGAKLYEHGLITDSNKIKLELLINERKQKLKTGYKKGNLNDGKQYQYLIKGWFHDEKKFMNEITPLLNITPIQEKEVISNPTPEDEGNFLVSTINDWLNPFKENINQTDYNILVSALETYFTTQSFPILKKEIKVSRINKKNLGWALNQLYRTERNDILPKEYLRFAKENISTFKNVAFDEKNILKSNLYIYFTTKSK